jgi:PGF-pre-PGF domain-containing protein
LLVSTGAASAEEPNVCRDLPASANPGDTITVILDITVDGADKTIVEDNAPAGWVVSNPSDDGFIVNPVNPEKVSWIDINAAPGVAQFTYDVTIPGDAAPGTYTFEGVFDLATTGFEINTIDCATQMDIEDATSGSNTPPTAMVLSISPNPAVESVTVTFNGSGTDPDGTIVSYNWTSSLDGQLNTSANFSTAGISLGTHTIYFSVQDDDGVWSDTVSATLTINKKTEISNSGGSSSSSSSGGGSGASGEAFENIAFKAVKTENIIGGVVISYTFDEEQNAIDYIKFSALKNYGAVSTTIEVLNNKSAMVDESAPGLVYSNLNIWVGKVGFATEDNIANPVIGFSVSKEWLTENEVKEGSIALYRYSEGKWNNLNTIKIGEDDSYIYFESETPGFSPFAISANAEEDDTSIVKDVDPKYAESDAETETPIDDEPVSEPKSTPGISGVLSLMLLGCAYVFNKRKN